MIKVATQLGLIAFAIAYSIDGLSVCKVLTDNVIFLDFNKSKEEIDGAREIAAEKCQQFHLIESKDQAARVIKAINDKNEVISSMILSGHHKFGVFWGENFSSTIGAIAGLFDDNPNAKKNLKNMYLWGCYTNNIDKLENWLESLPNLNYVFGFAHKSPLSNQVLGVTYLKSALLKQQDLDSKESLEQVKNFLDNVLVPGSSPEYHFVTAAIYGRAGCESAKFKDFYYKVEHTDIGTKSSIQSLDNRSRCATEMTNFAKKYEDLLAAYWDGDVEVMSLSEPNSKDMKANPLRMGIYPWANDVSFCFKNSFTIADRRSFTMAEMFSFAFLLDLLKKAFRVGKTRSLSLNEILNLVYFQTIKKNFFEFFKNDTSILIAELSKTNPEISEVLKKAPSLGRKEIIALKSSLSKVQNSQTSTAMAHKIDQYLVNLKETCVDINWLEDTAQQIPKQPPSCLNP